jgi:hypothetical protein
MVTVWAAAVSLLCLCVATSGQDSMYTCVPVNQSQVDSFCDPLLSRLPKKTCVDATGYRHRSKKGYQKQSKECSTELKRKANCPNDPSECAACQNMTFDEYCGVYDQACETDEDCTGGCYSDCYPCNTRANCDMLEAFGVIEPPGKQCWSPFNHSVVAKRAIIARARVK